MTTPAASRKDKHGHRTYAIVHPDTREVLDLPSWSRLKGLMFSGGLETWKLKKVAAAVAMSTALQMEAASPDTVYQAVSKALDADTEAADVGTYVHKYTEQVDAGTLDWEFVPPAGEPFIRAYENLRNEWAWEAVETEATIYNLSIGYAGSADRFMRVPGLAAHLGLPNDELDVFALDVKTGKVWPEVILQLCAYANGEGIFEAPSKLALGFTVREAQLEDDIRNGVGFDRINPNRRKWSDEAVREARAALDNEWWQVYAEHATHRPMPEGLRRDVGLVIQLHAEGAKLVAARLDGNPYEGVIPALHVIDGLSLLYRWGRRKDLLADVEPRCEPASFTAGPEPVKDGPVSCQWPDCAEPVVGVPCFCGPHWNRLPGRYRTDLWAHTEGRLGPATSAALMAEIQRWIADPEIRALAALDYGGLLAGAEVADAVDMVATDDDKTPYIEWLRDIANTRKHLLPALRKALDDAGLTKKLRTDTWTMAELRRWSQCAIAVERAGR